MQQRACLFCFDSALLDLYPLFTVIIVSWWSVRGVLENKQKCNPMPLAATRPDMIKLANIHFHESEFTDGVLDGDYSTSMILRNPSWDFAKRRAQSATRESGRSGQNVGNEHGWNGWWPPHAAQILIQCIDDMKHSDTLEDPEWTLPWLGKQVWPQFFPGALADFKLNLSTCRGFRPPPGAVRRSISSRGSTSQTWTRCGRNWSWKLKICSFTRNAKFNAVTLGNHPKLL